VQRILNCDKIQDTNLISDKVLSSMIHDHIFSHYIHQLRTFKNGVFLWSTLYSAWQCIVLDRFCLLINQLECY